MNSKTSGSGDKVPPLKLLFRGIEAVVEGVDEDDEDEEDDDDDGVDKVDETFVFSGSERNDVIIGCVAEMVIEDARVGDMETFSTVTARSS